MGKARRSDAENVLTISSKLPHEAKKEENRMVAKNVKQATFLQYLLMLAEPRRAVDRGFMASLSRR